jgi:hypothetical protein
MKRFVDCLCWHQHLDNCPNYVSLEERRAFYAALAGEAETAETTQIGSVHEHATAKPERPNLGLIVAVSLSVAVVSALWIVGGIS